MDSAIQNMENELKNSGLIPVFEEPVIDLRTGEEAYIVFNIFFKDDSLVAQHESLSQEQEDSDLIASVSVEVDTDFSLDENLQALSEKCNNAIIASDWFDFREE